MHNVCSTTTGTAVDLFMSAIHFFSTMHCIVPEKPSFNTVNDKETFDFIIVGGGSAGCVLANRLSEITGWNILLLEAGPEPPIESDIPRFDNTLYNSKYDWKYFTQSEHDKLLALKNNSVRWPRGKMLGGCSSINAMFYVRGRAHDYQTWQEDCNSMWSPENVEVYFKKAENLQDMELNQCPNIHGTYGHKGPLVVNTFNDTDRYIIQCIIDSWDLIGIKKVPDINAAKYEGYGLSGIIRVTATSGVRQSTYQAYLKPASCRNNLKIVTHAFVTKILINHKMKAYGVEVDVNGIRKTFYASLEVIVSAGSINTPQLLMLSGIGPKEHLLSKNIECLVNLPGVGKHLQDHLAVYFPIYGDEPGSECKKKQMFEVIKYLNNKTGNLAQGSFTDMTAFFSRTKNMKFPEFQSHLRIFRKNSSEARGFFNGLQDNVVDSFTEHYTDKALYIITLHLLHPFSRGEILLNTSNPYDYPLIYAKYYKDRRDLEATVDGMKIINRLLDTPYFKSINAFAHRVNITQCNHYEFLSDLYWECYVKHTTQTLYHPTGSAKMGPNPKRSVVNCVFKVYGIEKLRVIDASVMPHITSGNTNAPTIMTAEMGADLIKQEYIPK